MKTGKSARFLQPVSIIGFWDIRICFGFRNLRFGMWDWQPFKFTTVHLGPMPLPAFITNALTWWQWLILGAIPPLILALYFLKLKRQPLEVPSTYLWHRTIEDLHVNSLWQRLRQSILLFLQLLLIILIMLACLRPNWQGRKLSGDRFIFLVDTSASMSATDLGKTRLEAAKEQIADLIEQMKSSDSAMIISFSDIPWIEQEFTNNRRRLRRALAEVQPTHRTSNLDEALRYAAGLANPADSRERESDVISVADALPATLYIFSDGNVPDVSNFSLGNLDPLYTRMGSDDCENVGIVAFSAERHPENPNRLQIFGRIEHFTRENTSEDAAEATVDVEVDVFLDNTLVDAQRVQIREGGTGGFDVSLDNIDSGILKMEIQNSDHLKVDNEAYASVNPSRRAKVLVVSPGNEPLELALETEQVKKVAKITREPPSFLSKPIYGKQAAGGLYDLIIFDQCAPQEMPQSNTLFVGQLPPMDSWGAGEKQEIPQIIDMDRAHPLMQFIEMGNVNILEARPLKPPPGSTILIDSDLVQNDAEHSAIFAIAPRDGFEDAVMGFNIIDMAAGEANTDWHIRISFPLFVNNLLRYMGGMAGRFEARTNVKPGKPIVIRTETPATKIDVETPRGERSTIGRGSLGHFTFANTDQIGVYTIREEASQAVPRRFTVNLFDREESDIWPQPDLEIGHETVKGQLAWEPTRREAWKYVLIIALAILLLEWYVFNRRVYL